jgi:broad specificity phosphatase PhoE
MILVRHGESEANLAGIWQGHIESPLSELGREQATNAGRALRSREVTALYSSPLGRAMETAEIIAREIGYRGEIARLDDLIERHGGVLQGHHWPDYAAANPALAEKFLNLPDSERWALVEAESTASVLERARRALAEIRNRHGESDVVVVTTHGGLLKAFLSDAFGLEVFGGEISVPNTSITRIRYNSAGPELLELTATDHLRNVTTQQTD